MTEISEKELVRRAKARDETAFNQLFVKHENRIFKHVRHWTDTEEDAEDVVLQTFAKIWKNLPNFRGDSTFFTWAFKIAKSEASNFRSSLMRRPSGNLVTISPDQSIDDLIESISENTSQYDAKIAEQISIEDFDRALQELPIDLRDAFVLSEISGFKYEEIAEILDTPDGTIRSRISRARDALVTSLLGKTRSEIREELKANRKRTGGEPFSDGNSD